MEIHPALDGDLWLADPERIAPALKQSRVAHLVGHVTPTGGQGWRGVGVGCVANPGPGRTAALTTGPWRSPLQCGRRGGTPAGEQTFRRSGRGRVCGAGNTTGAPPHEEDEATPVGGCASPDAGVRRHGHRTGSRHSRNQWIFASRHASLGQGPRRFEPGMWRFGSTASTGPGIFSGAWPPEWWSRSQRTPQPALETARHTSKIDISLPSLNLRQLRASQNVGGCSGIETRTLNLAGLAISLPTRLARGSEGLGCSSRHSRRSGCPSPPGLQHRSPFQGN